MGRGQRLTKERRQAIIDAIRSGLSTEDICKAVGTADTTVARVRAELRVPTLDVAIGQLVELMRQENITEITVHANGSYNMQKQVVKP